MILGTHNSLTYWNPQKSWMNLFYRCQNKPIIEQLKCGVRMFDIKVRFNSYSDLIVTNGKWESELNWEPKRFVNWLITMLLSYKIDDKPIFINLTLDTNEVKIGQELDFISLVSIFKEELKRLNKLNEIILIGGHRSFDNEKIIMTIPDTFISYPVNKYSTQTRWYEKYFPKMFAKRMNKINMKLWENEDKIVAFDFI